MSGKQQNHHHRTSPKPRSKILFLILFIFSVSLLAILYTFSSSAQPSVSSSNPSDRPETSFVSSLENFLIHKAPKLSLPVRDDTARGVSDDDDDDVRKLDELVFERENRWLNENHGYPVGFPIKVYVYEMPKKFTFDLLWLFHNTYKETSNATSNGSPVHRLIEQVLTDSLFTLYSSGIVIIWLIDRFSLFSSSLPLLNLVGRLIELKPS